MRYTLLFVVACLSSIAHADEEEVIASAIRPANDVEWCTVTVQVVDAEGAPLEGATVRPWALRSGGGHGLWRDSIGAPRETATDRDGRTGVVYPKELPWRNVENPVVAVSIVVKHPEFVARNIHLNVIPDSVDVQKLVLKPGIRLRLAGVEPGTDKPLEHCYLSMENADVGEHEFVREANGWLRSTPISEDRRWFRVIHAAPGKPPRFSQLLAWTPDDPATRERLVEVRAGTRVEGKISDDVPRPIERGHVVAICGSPKRTEDQGIRNWQPLAWEETVPINADGSFVFESLPSGYLVQLFAMANNYISAQPSDESFEICCKWFGANPRKSRVFRYGQVLRLTGSTTEMTLEMEPAGEVRVKCVDPDGQPLRGVPVGCSPNQYEVGFGSTIFCQKSSSLSGLLKSPAVQESSSYWAKTGSDGVATIRNLPAGNYSFGVGGPVWTSVKARADSVPDRPTELVLTLRRLP